MKAALIEQRKSVFIEGKVIFKDFGQECFLKLTKCKKVMYDNYGGKLLLNKSRKISLSFCTEIFVECQAPAIITYKIKNNFKM